MAFIDKKKHLNIDEFLMDFNREKNSALNESIYDEPKLDFDRLLG